MEKKIILPEYGIPIVLNQATVIYANKLSEASGGWYYLPVVSTLIIDAVFRLKQNGTDLKVRLKDHDVPLYTNQDVIVLSVGNIVIGFVDTQTSLYYYITRDIAQSLGHGVPFHYFLLGAFALSFGSLFFLDKDSYLVCIIPLVLGWLGFNLYRRMINLKLRNSINAAIA